MTERNEHKNEKYQNGYAIDLDEPEGFIKVGHIDGVINRRRTNDPESLLPYLSSERIEQGLLVGYCSWDGDKLIPADGDYYSVDEVISKYEYEENGSLTYWTVSEWM